MKKTSHALGITLILILLLPWLLAAEETGNSIMQKVMDTQAATSSAMDIRLTLIDSNGEARERRIQTLSITENGLTNTITVFLSPASVKNTRFLTRERSDGNDDQWIYLPALGRVKRIAASEGNGSFMGSDFTYADMASTTYDTQEADHTLSGDAVLLDRQAYIVQSVPRIVSPYVKTITWVDKESFLPLRVEFYDKDTADPSKVLTTEEVALVDGRWLTRSITMRTLTNNHSTRIEILQAKYDIPMNSGYFTTTFLETGRTQ